MCSSDLINLVSKSAFERSGRLLRYSLNLIGNHENLDLRKTPHSHGDKMNYKIYPGANLDFTWPVTKRFGVVIAANHSRSFNEQHRTLQSWTSIVPPGSAAGTPINYANPILNSLALLDGPRVAVRGLADRRRVDAEVPDGEPRQARGRPPEERHRTVRVATEEVHVPRAELRQDRKSTRLNSSHT